MYRYKGALDAARLLERALSAANPAQREKTLSIITRIAGGKLKPSLGKTCDLLESMQWKRVPRGGLRAIVYMKDNFTIAIPASEEYEDFEVGIARGLDVLAQVEDICPFELYEKACKLKP